MLFHHVTQRSVGDAVRRVVILAMTLIAAFRGELMIFALGMLAIGATLALNDYAPKRTATDEHRS
jgi:hypothetical protein